MRIVYPLTAHQGKPPTSLGNSLREGSETAARRGGVGLLWG